MSATKMGMSLSDFVVTEAGFASDLGAEKFFDIKCQYGGLSPNAVVLVATIRALKYHGGIKLADLNTPNVDAVNKGLENLEKHIENLGFFHFKPVVALNKFSSDTEDEINAVKERCDSLGVKVALSEVWEKGGEGAIELAEYVVEQANSCTTCFQPLYKFSDSIEEKIEAVATKIYGAKNVEYSLAAKEDIKHIQSLGFGDLPICIAKTQNSLSDNPALKGRPTGFTVKIREVQLASGAGFVVPIAGTIMRMPGLPTIPSAELIDIDKDGNISGLF